MVYTLYYVSTVGALANTRVKNIKKDILLKKKKKSLFIIWLPPAISNTVGYIQLICFVLYNGYFYDVFDSIRVLTLLTSCFCFHNP